MKFVDTNLARRMEAAEDVPQMEIARVLQRTSTLPEYRGRGIQMAAIGQRLNRAIAGGCDLAVVVTLGNTTSQRNAERMGFTPAYSKATVVKKGADG